mmetsp:Transcript_19996/g.55642  ORF Transcript_19996/g.55642 Transcript_19996/m.55642 type:complete len:115 (+) Transcript_19996:720-1064(+)
MSIWASLSLLDSYVALWHHTMRPPFRPCALASCRRVKSSSSSSLMPSTTNGAEHNLNDKKHKRGPLSSTWCLRHSIRPSSWRNTQPAHYFANHEMATVNHRTRSSVRFQGMSWT